MKLGDLLEEILQEWLESKDHGQKIQDLWGVDGYICVCNFIEFVKEIDNDHDYDLREPGIEPEADGDGY